MRFVFAIVSFILAAALIGAGIAQRTIFAGPDEAVLTSSASNQATVTVIDGSVLGAYPGNPSLRISGAATLFAAYGRSTDVIAWIGDAAHNLVTFDPDTGMLKNTLISGTETEVPNPAGSDLWLRDYQRDGALSLTIGVPSDFSFIVVSDGVKPAPADIRVVWPLDNATPLAGPLIIGGAGALLIGLLFLLWAIHHMRRSRGPRRTQLKLPKVPKKRGYRMPKRPLAQRGSGRRSLGRGMMAAPALLIVSLLLAGCTMDFGGQQQPPPPAPPTPTATATAAPAPPPAVTESQAKRIIADISDTVAKADEAKDATLLATRMAGAALELRTANYAITTADPSIPGLAPIPAGPVKLILPQQTDSWPRTVFAVIQDDADDTVPSVALFLEQETARAAYKIQYAITLEPSQKLPDVAPVDVGAARLLPDNPVLRLTPDQIALDYADILAKDVDSDSYLDFQADGDSLRVAVGPEYQAAQRAALPTTASLAYGYALGAADAISLATNDAGALVAVNLNETTTVAPIEEGAVVNTTGQVKALSGLAVSSKGVIATYSDQLLFYVPPTGGGKIVLLGYTAGLVKAGEVG